MENEQTKQEKEETIIKSSTQREQYIPLVVGLWYGRKWSEQKKKDLSDLTAWII